MRRPELGQNPTEVVAPVGELSLRVAVEVVLSVAVDDGEALAPDAVLRPATTLVSPCLQTEPHPQALATDVDNAVAVSGAGALVAAQESVRVEDVVSLVPASQRGPVVRELVQESRCHGSVATKASVAV